MKHLPLFVLSCAFLVGALIFAGISQKDTNTCNDVRASLAAGQSVKATEKNITCKGVEAYLTAVPATP